MLCYARGLSANVKVGTVERISAEIQFKEKKNICAIFLTNYHSARENEKFCVIGVTLSDI